jgi:hypothetical protein
MTADPRTELLRLAEALCADTAGPADRDRLEELLAADAELWPAYLGYLHQHAVLRSLYEVPDHTPAPRPARPIRRGRVVAGLLAVAVSVLAFVFAWPTRSTDTGAVLSADHGCVWGTPGPRAGEPIPGGRLDLAAGIAEVTFRSGVTLLLEGPAELAVAAADRVVLRSGRVFARVPPAGVGFIVQTAAADVEDRGTEFGVAVDAGGGTTVQVYRGEVRTADHRLTTGEAARIRPSGYEAVAFRADRFVREFPPADARPATEHALPYNRPAFDTIRVRPAPGPVRIDGDLSDWDQSGGFRSRCDPPHADYEAAGWLMADDEFVYFAADVTDPHPMANIVEPASGRYPWYGGGLQVRLSTDPGLGWPIDADRNRRPPTPADTNDRLNHLTFWYAAKSGRAHLEMFHGMDLRGDAIDPPGSAGAFRKHPDGRGYTMEYAVPWSALGGGMGRRPAAGDVTGCCWTVHWSDAAGRAWRGQLVDVLNPAASGWTFHKADTWGRAVWDAPAR